MCGTVSCVVGSRYLISWHATSGELSLHSVNSLENLMSKASSIVALLMIVAACAFAGREPEASDKYPVLELIAPYGSSVFFAGSWSGKPLVAKHDSGDHWRTFAWRDDSGRWDQSVQVRLSGRHIVFDNYVEVEAFDMKREKWVPPSDTSTRIAPRVETGYKVEGWTFTVQKADKAIKRDFPAPSPWTYKRLVGIPQDFSSLNACIGPRLEIGKRVFFIIDYYGGEGSTGVGGVGLFDVSSQRFGVLRHDLLNTSSAGFIEAAGDTLIVATGHNWEYGLYGCSGLVLVNMKTGAVANVPAHSPLLSGTRFYAMRRVGHTLWLTTENGITGWDMEFGRWFSARAESLVIDRQTPLYRWEKTSSYLSDTGFVPLRDLRAGMKLAYPYVYGAHSEVEGPMRTDGWIGKTEYESTVRGSIDQKVFNPPITIWKDSALSVPMNKFKLSRLKPLKKSPRAIHVQTRAGWVRNRDVHPLYAQTADSTGAILAWLSSPDGDHDVVQEMFNEFEIERAEAKDTTPLLDTILVARRGDNLFRLWGLSSVLDAHWLPKYDAKLPTGMEFRFMCREGGYGADLTVENGEIKVYGKTVRRGETWTIEAKGCIKAEFKLLEFRCDSGDPNVLSLLKFRYRFWKYPVSDEKREQCS